MDLSEAIGIGAGVFTAVSMIPQLAKMILNKKAGDISVAMFIVLIAGLLMWVWYGVLKKDWPIIITNTFSFLLNILNIFFSLKYKKKNNGRG